MPRVLLVCYYFPPLGLAGVSRPLNLFKQLPSCGWDCEILTVKPVAYRKYAPELLEGLDLKKIHRAGSRDPQRLMYLLGIREVNPKTITRGAKVGESLFPDSKVGWVNAAVRLGKKLHEKNPYDAIVSTSPPISAHLVGMRLASECGIRWVADFRDLWSVAPIETAYRSERLVERGHGLKREIMRGASAIVGVNRAVAEYMGSGEVITNGFDADLAKGWGEPANKEMFSIALLGTYSDEMPVEPLFRVVRVAIDGGRVKRGQIEFLQVGDTDKEWLASCAERYGLADAVKMYGLKPRAETVKILSQCSLMYGSLAGHLAKATTSRVFDMLGSGRPILAYASPEGELARQIADAEHFILQKSNINEGTYYLVNLIERWKSGELEITPYPEYAREHSWKIKARQYAELLGRLK